MRFVIYGAGAIGGVIGGRLAQGGHEVSLLARGAHADAIRANGLRLESADDQETLHLPVALHPSELAWGDDAVVILAVKSQDTAGALGALAGTAPPNTPVVCAQNGVDNERQTLRHFANVIGMCVMCPTTHLQPGVVVANSAPVTGLLDIGPYPVAAAPDPTCDAIAAALRQSTFSAESRADIMRWKYTKLLMNLANAVEALCGPLARGGQLAGMARDEGIACLGAAGIDFASDDEDAARRSDLLKLRPVAGQRWRGGSSWQSMARGAGSIETDYLNGEIALLGRLHGVPTPVNGALCAMARHAVSNGEPPGRWSEDAILGLAHGDGAAAD